MVLKYILNLFALFAVVFICAGSQAEAASESAMDNTDDEYSYDYNENSGRCSVYDPYEPFNRKIFMVNSFLDAIILRPIAKGYGKLTNDYTKNRVGSFVSNLSEPLSTVNYALQGDSTNIFKSFWRFTINSTFGVAGLFDVASKLGLDPPPQTLGSTLAHYGVGQGPYIVLPIYGGMEARAVSGPLISDSLLNPMSYVLHRDFKLIVAITSGVHARSNIMPFTDYVSRNSPDPYIAIRNAILSQKEAKLVYPEGFRCPAVNQ